MNPYDETDLRGFLESIPADVAEEKMRQQAEENEKAYNEFLDGLNKGTCFLCGCDMDSFDENVPCFHWFTYPKGIRKKHFEKYLRQPIGFFQLDSYFRWLASVEKPFVNINDLKSETSMSSYLETTYKYKNIEWAFSIGKSDLAGHNGSKHGSSPHYHIQMRVDGRIFLNFNYFHIPFTEPDLFTFSLLEQAPDKFKVGHSYGAGVGTMEDEDLLQSVDDLLRVSDDPDHAPFHRQTMIMAPKGKKISGDIVRRASEESKVSKQPIGKIMQRLLKEEDVDANIFSILSPGDGVPEMVKRSGKE